MDLNNTFRNQIIEKLRPYDHGLIMGYQNLEYAKYLNYPTKAALMPKNIDLCTV